MDIEDISIHLDVALIHLRKGSSVPLYNGKLERKGVYDEEEDGSTRFRLIFCDESGPRLDVRYVEHSGGTQPKANIILKARDTKGLNAFLFFFKKKAIFRLQAGAKPLPGSPLSPRRFGGKFQGCFLSI